MNCGYAKKNNFLLTNKKNYYFCPTNIFAPKTVVEMSVFLKNIVLCLFGKIPNIVVFAERDYSTYVKAGALLAGVLCAQKCGTFLC